MSLANLPLKLVTKTRSPTTMGLDEPGPGNSTFQATFSLGPHLRGMALSALVPSPRGPRKRGQSSERREEVRARTRMSEPSWSFMRGHPGRLEPLTCLRTACTRMLYNSETRHGNNSIEVTEQSQTI